MDQPQPRAVTASWKPDLLCWGKPNRAGGRGDEHARMDEHLSSLSFVPAAWEGEQDPVGVSGGFVELDLSVELGR